MDLKQKLFLITGAFFAAYVAFVVIVPPDEHDCAAHNSPVYVPVRIFVVFSWLVFSWVVWEYDGRWFWSSFSLGGLAGGGFALVLLPVVWLIQGGPAEVLHWVRVLGGTTAYAVISALFAGRIPSLVRSSIVGFLMFSFQLAVDAGVHSPWFCIY